MIKDMPGLETHICELIRKECDVAVVGLSGGADSTLVAILCKRALGGENVVGVHMPYDRKADVESGKFNARSARLVSKIGITGIYIPITDIANSIIKAIGLEGLHDVSALTMGNAKARARMCVLYGLANHIHTEMFKGKRVRVVGTGNLSEDFIGYDTKGGDALTDFHPIGRLFKSEVYQMLDWYKEKDWIDEDHIDRVPSAGLWDGQTDEGELGHTYNEMEPIVRLFLEPDRATLAPFINFKESELDLAKFVEKRHFSNAHKHAAIPSFDVSEFVD